MKQTDMIDLLKALSVIEGAVRVSSDKKIEQVVIDELEWIVNLIIVELKQNDIK